MHMRIGGKEVLPVDDKWIPVFNPATGDEIGRVPEGTAYDVDAAVGAAEAAFDTWAGKTFRERGMIFFRGAGLIRQHVDELARLLTSEQGKPLKDATDEIRGFANILEFYAGLSASIHGELLRPGGSGDVMVSREPLGVCGAIIPWNMPAIIMGWKIGPALLAGNTLVFKPASLTPLTNLKLAGLLEAAGLPPGVLNIVTGKGDTVGEAIVRHPSVRKVSFTGDTETGKRIRELASGQLKELTLELGGSDPMIVWKDADLNTAVSGAVRGRFYNTGQTCTSVKRLYVHGDIGDEFTSRLRKAVEELKIGNGLIPGVEMGPLTGPAQLGKIERYVEEVRSENQGKIIAGGFPPPGSEYEKGYFYSPTLVTDPDPDCILLQREVFGPVLPVMYFDDLETAIRQANDTQYGLGASVWTGDLDIVKRVFSGVQAGVVWVNRHLTVPPELPFGGIKESGLGRENGSQAILSYTRTKSLFLGW